MVYRDRASSKTVQPSVEDLEVELQSVDDPIHDFDTTDCARKDLEGCEFPSVLRVSTTDFNNDPE